MIVFTKVQGSDPRVIQHYPRYSAYVNWSALSVGVPHAHTRLTIPWYKHRLLMKFRLGDWSSLQVHAELSRPLDQRRDRSERHCTKCAVVLQLCMVEDELHVVFECPAYQHIRDKFHALFTDDVTSTKSMTGILSGSDWYMLADFLHDIYRFRTQMNN